MKIGPKQTKFQISFARVICYSSKNPSQILHEIHNLHFDKNDLEILLVLFHFELIPKCPVHFLAPLKLSLSAEGSLIWKVGALKRSFHSPPYKDGTGVNATSFDSFVEHAMC